MCWPQSCKYLLDKTDFFATTKNIFSVGNIFFQTWVFHFIEQFLMFTKVWIFSLGFCVLDFDGAKPWCRTDGDCDVCPRSSPVQPHETGSSCPSVLHSLCWAHLHCYLGCLWKHQRWCSFSRWILQPECPLVV